MSLLVTGSIGIDTVDAPSGSVKDALGGSSIYFSYAASFFGPVRLVGVVGEDCPSDFLKPLHANDNIDLAGLEVRAGSQTFRWHGRYHDDVNERDTVSVDLNVLAEEGPTIPHSFRDSKYVFLANTHPDLQLEMLGQLESSAFVACDTMDLWIDTERNSLMTLLERIDAIILNDAEARQLMNEPNAVTAGVELAKIVKQFVVIKKGEHGCMLFADGHVYAMPGYPSRNVVDPTGAGDCFAGGFMGYLAETDSTDIATVRKAMGYGTAVASLELEDFSLNKLQTLSRADIDARLQAFVELTGC